jgi:hypothetical protein
MGQRPQGIPRMSAPIGNHARHRPCPQMPLDRSPTHQHGHANTGQGRQDGTPPRLRTDRWRRQIGPARIVSRKAKSHRHNGNPGQIIEGVRVQSQPVAQPIPAGVGKGFTRGLHTRARCLPRYQQPCRRGKPDHGSWLMRRRCGRKAITAQTAVLNLARNLYRHSSNTLTFPSPDPCRGTAGRLAVFSGGLLQPSCL